MTYTSKMRKVCDYFLILHHFLYSIRLIYSTKLLHFPPLYQIIPPFFILNHDFFILNQPFSYEKRRSPALNPFVLGCQCPNPFALPTNAASCILLGKDNRVTLIYYYFCLKEILSQFAMAISEMAISFLIPLSVVFSVAVIAPSFIGNFIGSLFIYRKWYHLSTIIASTNCNCDNALSV